MKTEVVHEKASTSKIKNMENLKVLAGCIILLCNTVYSQTVSLADLTRYMDTFPIQFRQAVAKNGFTYKQTVVAEGGIWIEDHLQSRDSVVLEKQHDPRTVIACRAKGIKEFYSDQPRKWRQARQKRILKYFSDPFHANDNFYTTLWLKNLNKEHVDSIIHKFVKQGAIRQQDGCFGVPGEREYYCYNGRYMACVESSKVRSDLSAGKYQIAFYKLNLRESESSQNTGEAIPASIK
jgi:hypothetical protein